MRRAVPRKIQWLWGMSVGNNTVITKFVLWPVVLSVPARTDVLYRGAWYRESVASILKTGIKCIVGSGGFISPVDNKFKKLETIKNTKNYTKTNKLN